MTKKRQRYVTNAELTEWCNEVLGRVTRVENRVGNMVVEGDRRLKRVEDLESALAHGHCWPWQHSWGRWTYQGTFNPVAIHSDFAAKERLTRRCSKCGKVQEKLV